MPRVLEVGDRFPDFVLPDVGGALVRFYGRHGGLPTAIVLPGRAGADRSVALVDALTHRSDIAACWLVGDARSAPAGATGYVDADGAVSAAVRGDGADALVVVLDPNLRVTDLLRGEVPAGPVLTSLERTLDSAGAAAVVSAQAPVLMVPRVIDPQGCAALVDQCRRGSVETGVEKSQEGARRDALDPVLKRRRDVTITDSGQLHALSATVGRRVMPEVRRAFAFRATRFEGFKIAWYDDAAGGFFAPHRDNLTESTAHRVFGLSINLNDDYAGGGLSFPEYGSQCYQAPAGAAMVFSCDLLHAVHPVTRGARFVLLSFLYAA